MAAAPEHVVVVGGGLAGARTVQELRAQGHRGRVTLVAAEPHRPYDRPPLSKELLLGRTDDTTLDVPWDELGVDLRLGTAATGLRPGVLETDGGEVPYDGLALCTGARPRTLPGVDALLLRTVDDARALRERLRPGARVVVIGAGWIGAEVATAAAAAGCRTTVVEAGPAPLAALGPEAGAATVGWYAAAGVDLRLGAAVTAADRGAVHLLGGEELSADVVVLGVGATPDTAWLHGTDLLTDQGSVAVDEHLAAAWPGVVAVGDCAAWHSRRYGTRLHVEHWDDALHGPAVAAATLLGVEAVHDPVPYFWSEQLGHRVQHAGWSGAADTVVQRGEPGAVDGWTTCWLQDGRLVALLAVDRPRDLLQGRRAVEQGRTPDPDRLADPTVPLKEA